MPEKIIQCCMTSLMSGAGKPGWQVVAASDSATASIRERYRSIQSDNMDSPPPRDAAGKPLPALYEVAADGEYVCVSRITYGLKGPGVRRGSRFIHSFLFPLTGDTVRDPNVYLTVSVSNFAGDRETAEKIPAALKRTAPYTLDAALDACGLDGEDYLDLIYCVYRQRERMRPLYLVTHRGEALLRPLLYCILLALPFPMRRRYSCAGADAAPASRTFIVTEQCGPGDGFYDLDTGKNNLLTERLRERYSRWEFMDYFVKHRSRRGAAADYCEKLDRTARRLTSPGTVNYKVLKVASRMVTADREHMGYSEARADLYDALSLPVEGNDFLDDYLAALLGMINGSGRGLDRAVDEVLTERLRGKTGENLSREGERYLVLRILRLDVREGVRVLAGLPESRFYPVSRRLLEEEGGAKYLDGYFLSRFPAKATWKSLAEYVDRVSDVCGREAAGTVEKLRESSRKLYERQLDAARSGKDFLAARREYVALCRRRDRFLCGDEDADRTARKIFWKRFSFVRYDFRLADAYERMRLSDSAGYRLCHALSSDIFPAAAGGRPEEAEEGCGRILREWGRSLSAAERNRILQSLTAVLAKNGGKDAPYFERRLRLMWTLGSAELLDGMERCRSMRLNRDCGEFTDFLGRNAERLSKMPEGRRMLPCYVSCLLDLLSREGRLTGASADVWLTAGGILYDNPFEILTHADRMPGELGELLARDPMEVAENSSLLFREEYREQAERFRRGGTEQAAVVKAWMAAAGKCARNRKREEAPRGGLFGLMNRLRGNLP